MDGTVEVWVVRVEKTSITLREFGHGGVLGLGFGFSLPKIGVLGAIAATKFCLELAATIGHRN